MTRVSVLLALVSALLMGCATTGTGIGTGGTGGYRIGSNDTGRIQFRMLDAVNVLRRAANAPELTLDSRLNAAAATHSRDMAVQNRPWLFGSDGSSPLDRVARVGYSGDYVGEVISESYETELETLAAWMESERERRIILDPRAREMGFAWFQEDNGKIWWTMTLGRPSSGPVTAGAGSSVSEVASAALDSL